MKHCYLYYAEYLKFNEETNELERRDKLLSKEIPLKQFAKTVIITVLITLLVCTLFTVLASLSLLENDNNIIPGLWVFGIISYALGALFCFIRLFDYDYRVQNYESALIDKIFSEEIKELELLSIQEQLKAAQWRALHPLEEKCRLAMTQNPNYVADLIRYVKEHNDEK